MTNKVKSTITKTKLLERLVLLLALITVITAVMMSSRLYELYLAKTYPKSNVYGTWVEQNVAAYAADEFVLSPSGVTIEGRVVNTQYSWDGSFLEYRIGDKVRKFRALNKQFTELQLISQPHYQPIYRLSEKFKNNIR